MSLTKAHLADSIQNQLDLPKNQSTQAVESIIEIIKKTLESGEDVLFEPIKNVALKSGLGLEKLLSDLEGMANT